MAPLDRLLHLWFHCSKYDKDCPLAEYGKSHDKWDAASKRRGSAKYWAGPSVRLRLGMLGLALGAVDSSGQKPGEITHLAMGENFVPPLNIPIPTIISSFWVVHQPQNDIVGFDQWPLGLIAMAFVGSHQANH